MTVETADVNNSEEEVKQLLESCRSDNQTTKHQTISSFWKQVFAALASIFGTLSIGANLGYSAILIPQLNDSSSKIVLTQEQSSWIAAMTTLPLSFACIFSGMLMERFGRRMSQILVSVPFIIGWIIIGLSNNIFWLLFGRFITGFCQGLHAPITPVYIGENSAPEYRGFFLAGQTFAMAFGIFVSHFLGTFLSWQWTAIVCSFFPFMCMASLLLCPETPSWLASRGMFVEAIESFRWLRGYEAHTELNRLLLLQIELQKQTNRNPTMKEKIAGTKNIFKKEEFYKPMIIMIGFFIMTQFSGINVIAFYAATMMKNVLNDDYNSFNAMLIADVFRVLTCAISCVLLGRYGRRALAIISGFLTMLSLLVLSFYLYLCSQGFIKSNFIWIPLTLIVLYVISSNLGIIPLSWVMIGELFPIAARGLGSSITVCIASIAFFISVKIAPPMFTGLEMHGTFLCYGCVALVGTSFLIKFLPETKGRTLLEVENGFKAKSNESN